MLVQVAEGACATLGNGSTTALGVALGVALGTSLRMAVGEAFGDEYEAELLTVADAQPADTKAMTAVSTMPLCPTLLKNGFTALPLQMNHRCDSTFS